jgi:MFS family permease
MLLAVAVAQITSWGVLYYAFAVFLAPMQAEFGWSMATLTGAYSLALLLSGLAAIPVGRWLDRHGPRALMTAGSLLATLLVVAWASVESVLGYYLVWAGIGLVMAAVLYEPTFVIVAVWFRRLRSRALTLLTFVAGFASVVYIPLAGWLVGISDWRTTLLILAGLLALGTIPIHALLLRRRPEDIGQHPDGDPPDPAPIDTPLRSAAPSLTLADALRDPAFWWTSVAFVLATFATMGITVHLIPYLTLEGYSPAFAATMAGLIGALALPGRLLFTPLGGWIARRYVAALIFLLQTVALLVLLASDSRLGVIVFVVLFGTGFGAITPARAAIIGDLYGSANYGAISGALALGITGSRAAAPVTAGLIVTGFGDYRPVLLVLTAASAMAVLAALQARPRHAGAM